VTFFKHDAIPIKRCPTVERQ